MTVAELIEKLSHMDQEKAVYVYDHHWGVLSVAGVLERDIGVVFDEAVAT